MIIPDLAHLATPLDQLELLPGNPRVGDVDAIARSLAAFDQRKPVVAKRDGTVIAGNHTVQAARALGWDEVAVVWVDDDDTTAHAYALADNRTAELGTYDDAALATLIAEVRAVDADLLAATGWTDNDLTDLLAQLAPAALPVDVDDVPASAPAIVRPGDVWRLGAHHLMCGDCRDAADVERLLAGVTVNVAFTSPPYAEQRSYDEASGFKPIPPDAYVEWFAPVAANVAAHLAKDGSWFVNIRAHAANGARSLYVMDLTLAHARLWGWSLIDDLIWAHDGLPGTWPNRFKNQYENILQFALGTQIKFRPDAVRIDSKDAFRYTGKLAPAATDNPISWSGSDVTREDGTALPGNVLRIGKNHEAVAHQAIFPVMLPQWFAQAYSDPGDVIFDPFVGSGSTLMAAHHEGRRGFGMELSPGYCDVTALRFERTTGIVPVHDATGEKVSFLDATHKVG